jgi:hypothetical protein
MLRTSVGDLGHPSWCCCDGGGLSAGEGREDSAQAIDELWERRVMSCHGMQRQGQN